MSIDPPPSLPERTPLLEVGWILLLSIASAFAINPYHYGIGDNALTLPMLKVAIRPELYPGDAMVAQREFYYTLLWTFLGRVHAATHLALPSLFLGVYLASVFATFLGVHRLARRLFGRPEVGWLALLFLLFSKDTLGSVRTIEMTLNTRAVAVPILLFALDAFLARRPLRAFALTGLAYLVHPLTTHYILAMLLVATLTRGGMRERLRNGITGLAVFAAVASPILWWHHGHAPPSMHWGTSDPRWLEALRLRSAHHMFPFSWGLQAPIEAGVVLVLCWVGWRARPAEAEPLHRIVSTWALTILALCVLGVVFSELWPLGLDFLVQPLRAFVFLHFLVALYVAHFVVRAIRASRHTVDLILPLFVGAWMMQGAERAFAAIAAYATFAAVTIATRAWQRRAPAYRTAHALVLAVVLATGACLVYDGTNHTPAFAMVERENPLWGDLEVWVREHTGVRDGIVVPPEENEEFRVDAERTVYVDSRDGGLMNSNPAYGIEWLRRMRKLGSLGTPPDAANFCRLGRDQVLDVAREMTANPHVFLIWPCGQVSLDFPVRYRNPGYVIYQVR